eukprot:171470_1
MTASAPSEASSSFFRGFKSGSTDASAKVLDFFRRDRRDSKKDSAIVTEPVRLTLQAGAHHSVPIRAVGAPVASLCAGSFRWFAVRGSDALEPIPGLTGAELKLNALDAGRRFCCQWVPDNGGCPSSFAEVGPLPVNPQIAEAAQNMYASGNSSFECQIPSFSQEKQTLTLREDRMSVSSLVNPDQVISSMRIRSGFKIQLPRSPDISIFILSDRKGNTIFKGILDSSEERDILALVVQRILDFDEQFHSNRKSSISSDVVSLELHVFGDAPRPRVSHLTARIEKLQVESIAKWKTIATFENRQAAMIKALDAANGVKELQTTQIKETTEMNLKLDREHGDAKRRVVELESILLKANTDLAQRNTEIHHLKVSSGDLSREFSKLKAEMDEMHSKLSSKESDLDGVIHENSATSLDIESLKSTLASTNSRVVELTDENNNLRSTLKESEAIRKDIRKALDESNAENKKSTSEIQSLENMMATVKMEKKQFSERLRSLQVSIDEGLKREELLENKMNSTERKLTKMDDLQTALINEKQFHSDLRERVRSLQKQLKKEQEMNYQHELQHEETAQKISALESKLKSATFGLDAARSSAAAAVPKSQLDEVRDQLARAEATLARLQIQLEEARARDAANEAELGRLRGEVEKFGKEKEGIVAKHVLESQKLLSDRNFFREKSHSLSLTMKKLIESPNTARSRSPSRSITNMSRSPSSSHMSHETLQADIESLTHERDSLSATVREYQRAYTEQATALKAARARASMAHAHTLRGESRSTVQKKNDQLQDLANNLSEIVAEKDEQLRKMREVIRFMESRIRELEKMFKKAKKTKAKPKEKKIVSAENPEICSTCQNVNSKPSIPNAKPDELPRRMPPENDLVHSVDSRKIRDPGSKVRGVKNLEPATRRSSTSVVQSDTRIHMVSTSVSTELFSDSAKIDDRISNSITNGNSVE